MSVTKRILPSGTVTWRAKVFFERRVIARDWSASVEDRGENFAPGGLLEVAALEIRPHGEDNVRERLLEGLALRGVQRHAPVGAPCSGRKHLANEILPGSKRSDSRSVCPHRRRRAQLTILLDVVVATYETSDHMLQDLFVHLFLVAQAKRLAVPSPLCLPRHEAGTRHEAGENRGQERGTGSNELRGIPAFSHGEVNVEPSDHENRAQGAYNDRDNPVDARGPVGRGGFVGRHIGTVYDSLTARPYLSECR